MKTTSISYRTTLVDGCKIFYREAGDPKMSAVPLLWVLSCIGVGHHQTDVMPDHAQMTGTSLPAWLDR